MLIFQIRPRVYRHKPNRQLTFPAEVSVQFHMSPGALFGADIGGVHTVIQNAKASMLYNANVGTYSMTFEPPMDALDVKITETSRVVKMDGDILTVTETFDDLKALDGLIQGLYYVLPLLLNAGFSDPPIIERVGGTIDGTDFNWELEQWNMTFHISTQDAEETKFVTAWQRQNLLSTPGHRRLLGALHYFHVACRLARRGATPGEFLAEMVLNLAKTLQALFPSSGDGRDMDACRTGLRALEYTEEEIESTFVPAIALRNYLGVGHVELSLFKEDDLRVVHAYVERAEGGFRKMLDRVLTKVAAGEFEVPQYDPQGPRSEVISLIKKLRENTPPQYLP